MTYGYRPDAEFQTRLEQCGISPADIERVEFRPAAGLPATVDVVVTMRSGRSESWRQRESEGRPAE